MRAVHCTQIRAKSAKNDLKPTGFLKHNFYFEREGVDVKKWQIFPIAPIRAFSVMYTICKGLKLDV